MTPRLNRALASRFLSRARRGSYWNRKIILHGITFRWYDRIPGWKLGGHSWLGYSLGRFGLDSDGRWSGNINGTNVRGFGWPAIRKAVQLARKGNR